MMMILFALLVILLAPLGPILAYMSGRYLAGRILGTVRVPSGTDAGRMGERSMLSGLALRSAGLLAAYAMAAAPFLVADLLGGREISTRVIDVLPGPAEEAGLRDGDEIIAVDDAKVSDFDDVRTAIQKSVGPVKIDVRRGGSQRSFRVSRDEEGLVRIVAHKRWERPSVGQAVSSALAAPAQVLTRYLMPRSVDSGIGPGALGSVFSDADTFGRLRVVGVFLSAFLLVALFVAALDHPRLLPPGEPRGTAAPWTS